MRIFYLILILAIAILDIQCYNRCKWHAPRYHETLCAIDMNCNFQAANRELLNMEICRRRANNNKRQFLYIIYGKCPKLRKICNPTIMNLR